MVDLATAATLNAAVRSSINDERNDVGKFKLCTQFEGFYYLTIAKSGIILAFRIRKAAK